MANTYLLIGLKRQYAKTLGALHVAHGDRVRLMGELGHLAAVIRIFAPETDVEAIKPLRQWKNRRGRKGVNWSRLGLDVLRRANAPMTTRQIARRIAHDQGIAEPRTIASIECTLSATLAKRIGEGVVMTHGAPKRWALASD